MVARECCTFVVLRRPRLGSNVARAGCDGATWPQLMVFTCGGVGLIAGYIVWRRVGKCDARAAAGFTPLDCEFRLFGHKSSILQTKAQVVQRACWVRNHQSDR